MNFKFRNKEYVVIRDSMQFTLKELVCPKDGNEPYYTNERYYSNVSLLIKRLISLHCVSGKDGREMLSLVKICCEQVGAALNRGLKASMDAPVERSSKIGASTKDID